MVYKVDSSEDYSLSLQQNTEISSVLQNISLLLNTKKGTSPMYRDFGLPMAFVDKPLEIAETIAFVEISDAIEQFESRAKFKDLSLKKMPDGRIAIIVEVSIDEQRR